MRLLHSVFTRLLLLCALVGGGAVAGAGAANAAVPDVWGFAYVDTSSGVPNLSYQAGSWTSGAVTVSPGVPGEYYVRFPNIGIPTGGIAHVTAISQTAEWCQIEKWGQSGPDEIVVVRCYRFGGGPAKALFSLVFASSSGALSSASQAFGYVYWDGSSIASDYNSSLGANAVFPGSTGVWTVWLPGLGSSVAAGDIQVTAVDSTQPARCKVGAWSWAPSGQKIQVLCHDATVNPLDTGWTLTYQRERAITGAFAPPKLFAYTFDNVPANPGPYAPVPPQINFNYPGAVNTVQSAGLGLRLVTFPKVGALPNNVQVTAYGPGPEFCNLLTLWTTAGSDVYVRDVACYKATTRVNEASFVTYTSVY
ncbi:hypothetical protein OHB01_29425 [Microbispora hainanensis]|uniref:Uncharacterized protein n=1 Tax=Microbispora hainanensis TaxID=568844 RepID=A0ABZ1SWX9_9ACTN|nr:MULTISPECIES: hypothetical protein [Microbispora]NJP28646.1 hypothetical protein [Microbispora sp. CL1-1]TQS07624.1 hypothetical protein FLW53_31485 [Microbispora sp. SCL1-1]